MGTGRRTRTAAPVTGLTAAQDAALLMAGIFGALGILGFIPGVTTGYDTLAWAHNSGAELFGIFSVSVLLNVVHLMFGVAGLLSARTFWRAKAYLFVGGALALVLWGYGLAVHGDSTINPLALDNSDNWLHLGLGAVMVLLAFTLAGVKTPAGMTPVLDP